jgi:AAA family ATP:ADP antiporter
MKPSESTNTDRKPLTADNTILSMFSRIHRQEVRPVLWLTLNFFVLFSAYYLIKPVREGLILSLNGGAELKSSVGSLQAVFFILLTPLYRVFSDRFRGRSILIGIYLFMATNLLAFLWLGLIRFHYLGVVFFFWVGVFNMLTISQTFSLCAEAFTREQGERVFPIIALGAAGGAAVGSLLLKSLVDRIGLYYPMAGAAFLLTVSAVLIFIAVPKDLSKAPALPPQEATAGNRLIHQLSGGLGLVFQKRYIALIAAVILVSNLINTNSEYMLGKLAAEHFRNALGPSQTESSLGAAIGNFYATFALWVNVIVLLMQAFIVSRAIRWVGVSNALWLVPLLALFSYSAAAFFPLFAVIAVVKVAENATDYSLNNTAREILFLPLTTKEKYQAKLAADTVFRRLGDALSRPMVFLLIQVFTVGIGGFAGVNLALVSIWLILVYFIGKERKRIVDNGTDTRRG